MNYYNILIIFLYNNYSSSIIFFLQPGHFLLSKILLWQFLQTEKEQLHLKWKMTLVIS